MSTELSIFITQVYNGLALAGVYLLVALGITLVYGLTNIVNFAQGEIVTAGAFTCLTLVQSGIPLGWALPITAVGIGLLSEVLDLGLFRRTLSTPRNGFLVSLGLIVSLPAAYASHWIGDAYSIAPLFPGTWQVGTLIFNKERAFLIGVTAAVGIALFLFLRSHTGRGIRALAEDRISAQVLGVPVGRLISVVFIIGSGLAGLAGGLLGTIFPFTPFFGMTFLMKGFAVTIIGGLGNVRGAVVASLMLGLAESLGTSYISIQWANAISLGATVAIILFRPYGLFQGPETASADPIHGMHLMATASRATVRIGKGFVADQLMRLPRISLPLLIALGLVAPMLLVTQRSVVIATFGLVNAIAAYSLWFGLRYAGIFSVAQSVLVGVGAYWTAIAALRWGQNFWLYLPVAVILSAAMAAIFGYIALRATGSLFMVLLISLSDLLIEILLNGGPLTGGRSGLVVPKPPDALGGLVDFGQARSLYYLVFCFLIAVILLVHRLGSSKFGRLLSSIRDNDVLARSLGLSTFSYRLAAFTISGGIAGLGGAMYLYAMNGVEPSWFNSAASVQLVLMTILGGAGSLAGPLVGSAAAIFIPELLHISPYQAQVVYGLVLIAIILLLPLGLVGTLSREYPRFVAWLTSRSRGTEVVEEVA